MQMWSSDKFRLLEKLVDIASSFERRDGHPKGYPTPLKMIDIFYKTHRLSRVFVNIIPPRGKHKKYIWMNVDLPRKTYLKLF